MRADHLPVCWLFFLIGEARVVTPRRDAYEIPVLPRIIRWSTKAQIMSDLVGSALKASVAALSREMDPFPM